MQCFLVPNREVGAILDDIYLMSIYFCHAIADCTLYVVCVYDLNNFHVNSLIFYDYVLFLKYI